MRDPVSVACVQAEPVILEPDVLRLTVTPNA